jgi:hypothetical protein
MPTVAQPNIMQDPGFIYLAPALTTFPVNTVAGSKFTDAPSVTWVEIGATEDGSTFSYSPSIEPVTVAEFLDPVKWRTVSREGSFAFNLADYTMKNLQRALNGGTLSTVSGTGATTLTKYVPPGLGQETRAAIMWESQDATMRIFMYQTVNIADVESAFAKAPSYAVLPCEFRFEVDSAGNTFEVYTAGTGRVGV